MFEWDEVKNESNFSKHGIRFEDSVKVFKSPMVIIEDTRYDYGEVRYIGIGKNPQGIFYTVVYTLRGDKIRIISARKAHKKERSMYEYRYS